MRVKSDDGSGETIADLVARARGAFTGHWWRGPAALGLLCAATFALPSPKPKDHSLSLVSPAFAAEGLQRSASAEPGFAERTGEAAPFRVRFADALDLQQMLRQSGLATSEAAAAASMIARAAPLVAAQGGVADVTLEPTRDGSFGRKLVSISLRASLDTKLTLSSSGGRMTLTKAELAVSDAPFRIRGRVGESLYLSAREAGAPPQAVAAFIRAIASQIDIGEVRPEDSFDMVLQGPHAADGRSDHAQLLYAGLVRPAARPLQLMQWSVDGTSEWVEASGAGRAEGLLQRPVPGTVSSDFGMRQHPILGYTRMHKGVDFRAGYGTPILAVADGRVAAAGWAGGYGEQVRLQHGGGLMTSYSHMSRIAAAPGSIVRRGDVIGYVGSTGLSTGPHLHFETYIDGTVVDPASVRFAARPKLEGSSLAAFRTRMKQLLALSPVAVPQA